MSKFSQNNSKLPAWPEAIQARGPMKDTLLTIQQAASELGVSTKTLRRWEARSVLIPGRTQGNQRRYTRTQIEAFREEKVSQKRETPHQRQEIVPTPASLPEPIVETSFVPIPETFKKATLLGMLVVFVLAAGVATVYLLTDSLHINAPPTERIEKELSGAVLSHVTPNDLRFNFNIPVRFLEDITAEAPATFSAGITAPNIIYDVLPGNNILISEGQTPTISLADSLVLAGGITLGNILNLGQLASDPSTAINGANYYNTTSNKLRCYQNGSWKDCDTDTTSSGDITGVSVGNGLSGGGSSGDVTINLDVTTTSTTTTTSANSGLEVTSAGLSLLRGCSASQVLQWNASTNVWECTTTSGTGDITAVGSMTTGDVFADSTADDDWLGLGAGAGRIEFDDQTIDEVNILSANVGIGTSTPGTAKLAIIGGNVGIGTTSPVATLDVVGTGRYTSTLQLLNLSSTSGTTLCVDSSNNIVTCASGSAVSGSGTTNFLTKWTSGSAIGNSLLFDNGTNVGIGVLGTNVGIGTTAPTRTLELAASSANMYFSSTSGPHVVATAGTTNLALLPGGNVGIGTTTPNNLLAVSGSGSFGTYASTIGPTNGLIVSGNVGIGTSTAATNLEVAGALRLSTTTTDTFTTPQSSSVATKINIPLFNPGAFGQLVITGLPSSAPDTARAFTFVDARTVAHQPTLGVFSVDENDLIGFSWEGTSSTAYLKTLTNVIGFRVGTTDYLSITSATGVTVASGIDLTLTSGTGRYVQTFTGTTTNAATITANSLTTGTGLVISSTSTAGGASGNSFLLDLSRSGANSNTAHTAYGIRSQVTNTNATSGTNIGGYFSASGATTANYGLLVANGNVGIGDTTPSSLLEVGNGTDSLQVSSVGDLTFVDADGAASITGPDGGAFGIAAANSQALNLTTTTAGNISLDPAGAGDITLVTANASGSNLNIAGLASGTGNALCVDGTNNVVTCTVGSGGISGGGAVNYIAKFTSASNIANAIIFDNGNVGVGTSNPLAQLHVVGDGTTTGISFLTADSNNVHRFAILDNGNVGIGTTNPSRTLDIAGASSNLYFSNTSGPHVIATAGTTNLALLPGGNVGIGTTAPAGSNKLHVEGQCVTGDSILITEDGRKIRVDEVKPGMKVYTLHQESGTFIPAQVNALLDMGVKPVFRLTTASGKQIRTTGNHPYLVKDTTGKEIIHRSAINGAGWIKVVDLKPGDKIAVAQDSLSPFQGLNHKNYSDNGQNPNYSSFEKEILNTIHDSLPFLVNQIARPMPTIAAGRFVVNSDQKSASVNLGINGIAPNQAADKLVNRPESTTSVSLSTFHITNDTSINQTGFQWDEIVSIEYVGEEQVWDLSIEGTHNFLANGIVAHNTYILGNLGVGSSSPGAKLQVTGGGATVGYQEGVAAPSNGLAVFGNVGIGTTSPVAALDVRGILYANNGTAGAPAYSFSSDPDTGLFSQGANLLSLATAGTQRLTINSSGNVGIGTTNPGTSLDVRGNVTILAGSDIRPTSDSTTAINIANAAGTDMVTFDTTNTEVRMGTSLGSNENALLTLTPASATETTETLVFFSNSANFTLTIDTALTNQRFNQFTAPTIAAGAATDVTNAATVYISNAPIASVVTITNNYALWVDAGLSRFDGNVGIGSTAAGSTLQVNGNGVIGFGTTAVAGPSRGLAVSGNVGIGTTSPAQPLDVVGLINTSFGTSQSSVAVCHSGVAGASTNNDVNLIDCTGTPGADYMEMYSVEQNVEPGDIVVPGANSITTTTGSQLAKLTKSTSPYQQNLIGIVSNPQDAGDFNSIGYNIKEEDNPKPIALNGRVATKVSTENGPIAVGDFLTSSSTRGVAMKATRPGQVVGKALEEFPGTQGDPLQGKILVFVNVTFADPNDTLANLVIDENGNITTKKSAFADNLVNLTGSSNDWTDTLEGTITNNDGFVKGMDLPGVEPGRLGVSIQSSEPARPTPQGEYQVLPDLSTKTITILDEWGPTTIIIRNEGGKLVMKNAQGTPTIAFDTESGSGYFTGDLIAKTLRVENIKGIDLSALIASQSATLGVKPLKEASASGESDSEQLLSRLEQLSSKLVSEASSSSQLNLDSVTAFTNLTSVGKTFLADTNIAGKLTVGTMTFDDLEDSVNTIGTLKFQDSPLAGAIELFSGSVKLARNGDIETEGVLSAKGVKTQELTITLPQEASSSAAPTNKSIGEGTIKTGDTSVIIETENVKTSSKIFVTATKLLSQPIIVTGKIENKSFTVAIAKPEAQDITFDWWIVNTQRLTLAP